jgi:putative transposase
MVYEHHLSRVRACQAVGLARSALYKPTRDRAAKDAPVIDAINVMLEKRAGSFGSASSGFGKTGTAGTTSGCTACTALCALNLKRKVRRRVLMRERQPLLASSELSRVRAMDFMRDTLYDGRPFRTLNVIDEGNREALCIECGTSIPSSRVVRVLEQLVEMFGRPEAIRLDNGPELTAEAFVGWAEKNGVKLLFIQPGKPNQNAFIERFNRSFRQEVLDAWLFNAVSEVQTAADDWLTDYNEYRPHDSLGNVPPAVFKPRVFNQEVSTSGLSTWQGSLRVRQ